MEAINTLPEKQKTAVYLYYYEDMSVSEIAEITSSSESAVKVRLNRARAMLKELLEGVQFDV